MAHAIIEQCLRPSQKKTISFLSTGNEIVQGELQDSNSHMFSKEVSAHGGAVYQHIHSSDSKADIVEAIQYLLGKSDAVVITGGLGPTSDDTTRFAIAEAIQKELEFDQDAWAHISNRLEKFNLRVTPSNHQQALFPQGYALYANPNGTALGCHLVWNNRHLFMLPGPPKECMPMFHSYVMPELEKQGFFKKQKIYRWLTLGLIEGEIAPEIDALAESHPVITAYRWNYPYLEIKLIVSEKDTIESLVQDIDGVLASHIVSRDGRDSEEVLAELLAQSSVKIAVIDDVTSQAFSRAVAHPNLIESRQLNASLPSFVFTASHPIANQNHFAGTVTFACIGYTGEQPFYQHQMSVPNRGAGVIAYAKAYLSWQLGQFIRLLEK